MPRQKEPIELKIAKGNSHMTKAEIEERRNSEVKAPSNAITPPKYLNTKQRKRFKELRDQLLAIGENGIIANVDAAALARYVVAEMQYEVTTKQLQQLQEVILDPEDTDRMSAHYGMIELISRNQDRLFKQCRTAAADLGLTITSRCKISVPVTQAEPKTNRFGRFEKESNAG